MTVLRFLAGLLLLTAAVALATDVTRSLSTHTPFAASSVERHWADIAPKSLAAARNTVGHASLPIVWDGLIAPVLKLPSFLLFGVTGILLGWLGRHRKKLNVFVN